MAVRAFVRVRWKAAPQPGVFQADERDGVVPSLLGDRHPAPVGRRLRLIIDQ
jgi:hypothetical protein